MRNAAVMLIIGLFSTSAWAWGDCKYDRKIERAIDVGSVEVLELEAGAGTLQINGESRSDISILATLCANSEQALDEMDVITEVGTEEANIRTHFGDGRRIKKDRNRASIDLVLTVPSSMKLNVVDSSGEASVKDVASLDMVDSSGDLSIKKVAGDVSVIDSSGKLIIKSVGGNLRVTDSSGDLRIKGVRGGLIIDADSSGGIDISDVSLDVLIKRDSSGSIAVEKVGGGFTVGADTSGDIQYKDVTAQVSLPR